MRLQCWTREGGETVPFDGFTAPPGRLKRKG